MKATYGMQITDILPQHFGQLDKFFYVVFFLCVCLKVSEEDQEAQNDTYLSIDVLINIYQGTVETIETLHFTL